MFNTQCAAKLDKHPCQCLALLLSRPPLHLVTILSVNLDTILAPRVPPLPSPRAFQRFLKSLKTLCVGVKPSQREHTQNLPLQTPQRSTTSSGTKSTDSRIEDPRHRVYNPSFRTHRVGSARSRMALVARRRQGGCATEIQSVRHLRWRPSIEPPPPQGPRWTRGPPPQARGRGPPRP